jgi:hypothetical protein
MQNLFIGAENHSKSSVLQRRRILVFSPDAAVGISALLRFVKHPLEERERNPPTPKAMAGEAKDKSKNPERAKTQQGFFVLPIILYFVTLSNGFRNYILQTATGTS